MSVFTQLVKSLYSPKDMALFRFQKIGKTILYIMLLSLIATIPKTFTFEKKDIISAIDSIYPILMLVVGIGIYLFQLFISFLGVTILAFIGSAMSDQRKLSYTQIWTLTAYSYTIPTIFFIIMDLLKINVPWSFLLYTAIILIVLYLTIKEIPKPKEKHEL
ncbi:hypothetical protein COL60_14600 [Bacillus pseudomycoides]|uniref:DUF1189 family protein n=1 Tax=Bacillus pseudomycoides TaxID=64104 RepID=UPI000BEC6C2A|nr:DUF1189 family protein [Bacillus pseudomycoides]PEA85158.1 hypothetical protein CON99_01415 [Bacillus pseudomycoides]PFZ09154.1 hypothetical protein COL60_14600 [Bacillus pseudomycoides]